MSSWRECLLWQALKVRSTGEKTRLTLEFCMPKIEETLRSGTPGSPSFTLHDNEHSFRVAEMMVQLLGGDVSFLSDIELAMLIMSAYCHDIGMSPERDRVRKHVAYLITGESDLLSQTDQLNLQSWLDTNKEGITPPIERNQVTSNGLIEVEEISAYYTRSRHNDWSEEWIRENLTSNEHPLYHRWLEDLITLCKSHHEGINQLKGQKFNAKQVSSPSQPLNLRYLACLLRLADVLEFSPERTPEVILKQRSVNPSSRIFWYKDHSITFTLDYASGIPNLSARTSNAAIHHAVLQTAEWVDTELALCSTLNQEGAFSTGNLIGDQRFAYKWPWSARLHTDVKEADDSFVYIQGAFRPDSLRVLDLLSGTALYSQPIIALRELMQNSLDAVREQIAYERLQQSDPLDSSLLDSLSRIHRIKLVLSKEDDYYWLRCIDDGTGMTRSQIEKSLLVSGSSVRGDLHQLERRAKQKGFHVGRTGKFGIGVLSYFMIADKMVVSTRRSQESNDSDGTGWTFEIDGIGSFGQLYKLSRAVRGTEISLRLRNDVIEGDASAWFVEATNFLIDQIRHSPCQIEFHDDSSSSPTLSIGPGWTKDHTPYAEEISNSVFRSRSDEKEMMTHQEELRSREEIEYKAYLSNRAAGCFSVCEEEYTIDSEPYCQLRLKIHFWNLAGGASVVFLDIDNDYKIVKSIPAITYNTTPSIVESWQGIKVNEDSPYRHSTRVEIDFKSGRSISVDRFKFVDDGISPLTISRASARDLWRSFLKTHCDSMYNEVNTASSPLPLKEKSKLYRPLPCWPIRFSDNSFVWSSVTNGIVSVDRLSFYSSKEYLIYYQGEAANEAVPIRIMRRTINLYDLYSGGRVINYEVDTSSCGIIGILWDSTGDMVPYDGSVRTSGSAFPPEWKNIFAITHNGRPFLNSDHPVFVELKTTEYITKYLKESSISDEVDLAVSSKAEAAFFIYRHIGADADFWIAMSEKFSDRFKKILSYFDICESNKILILRCKELYNSDNIIDLGVIANTQKNASQSRSAPKVSQGWYIDVKNVKDIN